MKRSLLTFWIFILFACGFAQPTTELDKERFIELVKLYKADPRGPYRDIRWFCNDGTTVSPQEKCKDIGAVQRARYKDEVLDIASQNHIFLGQILSTTSKESFWDNKNQHSRAKQYLIEKYLQTSDDGWINRKAQYYRGAFQVEDEQAWGKSFLQSLVINRKEIDQEYFLLVQLFRSIPHGEDTDLSQRIRAVSKALAEQYPAFMNLRIKIHGQPGEEDLESVKLFYKNHQGNIFSEGKRSMEQLILDMSRFYAPIKIEDLKKTVSSLSDLSQNKSQLLDDLEELEKLGSPKSRAIFISPRLYQLRKSLNKESKTQDKLILIDFMIQLERLFLKEIQAWEPKEVADNLEKNYSLALTIAAMGYIEIWEWEKIQAALQPTSNKEISLGELSSYHDNTRKILEWGSSMVQAKFNRELEIWGQFEPKVYGFTDNLIRSSLLLELGDNLGFLSRFISKESNFSNHVFELQNQNTFRGLNPGFALGELKVVDGSPENTEIFGDKIYIFRQPPSDLKPIAGIATVTEGNAVSHVQLLARNLGIPNAVLSSQNLQNLKRYDGQRVFYAVSNQGKVILKLENTMSLEEKSLFLKKERKEEKIEVPFDKINLANLEILNLREIGSEASGKLCGPKAANLGELKRLFPNSVVEGLVVPFSIFRNHMDLPMPNTGKSYWQYLESIFYRARQMETSGALAVEVESFTLSELKILREAISKINLKESFVLELRAKFREILGSDMGKLPVFLRSDTNMEDLKDFSGAGLNLTLFNVLEGEKILQGIKDVWASPYTERSYKWRQKYLLNPENVFPSILIIPSVNVDHSGVIITKGISSDKPEDITLAFSKGVGGAVDGQRAESYLLSGTRTEELLAPAREVYFNTIPPSGGRNKLSTSFENPILSANHILQIRYLVSKVRRVLPQTPGIGSKGPYDIELGFLNGKLWLFQVRPFVENKKALSSTYLQSIDPIFPKEKRISLLSDL